MYSIVWFYVLKKLHGLVAKKEEIVMERDCNDVMNL